MPRVTVLMPVFNASPYLREAMDSVLNQTLTDLEFLIIDDGSTDGSIEIIRTYTDPRIRLLFNERNLGISATLNRGIKESASELIARMDADDISYQERLEKQVRYMEANADCGLLSSWARVVTSALEPVRVEKYHHEFYYYNLNFECWIYHPTVIFRKHAAEKVGMYSKPFSEDYDLFWKLAREFRISNIDEVLLDYRLSPTSLNTVTKKVEYDIANRENVIRNLRHYMGSDYFIPEDWLECLRHNFSQIVLHKRNKPILACLRELDRITAAISATPNINLKKADIRHAARHKKDFIIEQIFHELPGFRKFTFAFQAGKPSVLFWKIHKSLRWRFNFAKERLLSPNKL
jgi:glycosyltransferase involved in cell wall biosynthesis